MNRCAKNNISKQIKDSLVKIKFKHLLSVYSMKFFGFSALARDTPMQHPLKRTGHQSTTNPPVQFYEREKCSICCKRRSCSPREMTILDQYICSRPRCATLKTLVADIYSSETLTIEIHHYSHSKSADSYVKISELQSDTTNTHLAELPGDFSYLRDENTPAITSKELSSIVKFRKPWQTRPR
jgi:hypothetical protein